MTPETSPEGARARAALVGSRFADLRWQSSTDSTNSDVMALAHDGAPEGIVLVADHQSAGRGRLGRTWEAPSGSSLLVSVLLRPAAAVADAVTMAAGVAMVEAVREVTGIDARLKWPNDLVVAVRPDDGGHRVDRKLAGILAEADWPARSAASSGWSEPPPGERVVVVVGVGVNVNWPAEIPEELGATLAACNHLTGEDVDRSALLVAYLRRLEHWYAAAATSRAALQDAWRASSATLGRRVRVDLGAEDVEGTAIDIDGAGRLVVETPAGVRRTLAVGDVVHLRPD